MAFDTTIHRDAEGRVELTTEQAQELAEWALAQFAERNSMARDVVPACCQEPGDSPWDALARWVLQWAPVAAAAVRLVDRRGRGIVGDGSRWWLTGKPGAWRCLECGLTSGTVANPIDWRAITHTPDCAAMQLDAAIRAAGECVFRMAKDGEHLTTGGGIADGGSQ